MRTLIFIAQLITTEMLFRLNNKTVHGPNFVVFVPDIHRVQYTEGEKVACAEIEGGFGPDNQVNWMIYAETLRGWNHPHEDEDMVSGKRQEILANISKSFDLLGMLHRVV